MGWKWCAGTGLTDWNVNSLLPDQKGKGLGWRAGEQNSQLSHLGWKMHVYFMGGNEFNGADHGSYSNSDQLQNEFP